MSEYFCDPYEERYSGDRSGALEDLALDSALVSRPPFLSAKFIRHPFDVGRSESCERASLSSEPERAAFTLSKLIRALAWELGATTHACLFHFKWAAIDSFFFNQAYHSVILHTSLSEP